jgi:hypothetical protein
MARWCRQGKTPESSTRALWHCYQQSHLGASRIHGCKEWNCSLVGISITLTSDNITCLKMLRHGTSRFTSHLKENVLRIFITLKNLSPQPGLNPRPLGPVASTVTTTPPKRFTDKLILLLLWCDARLALRKSCSAWYWVKLRLGVSKRKLRWRFISHTVCVVPFLSM